MGHPDIQARTVEIGEGVTFGERVRIGAIGGRAESVHIGDHTYIGDDVTILAPEFSVGDYSKLHRHSLFSGYQPMRIGNNAWFGQGSVIDSSGGTDIGDNCCVGAHSSLWSHMRYGDTLIGCRFDHHRPLTIGKDVWIGDSTVVTPCVVGDQVLVLANSVVTRDLSMNRIYAGSPSVDVTEKLGGPPYGAIEPLIRLGIANALLRLFSKQFPDALLRIHLVETHYEFDWDSEDSYFEVTGRTYTKHNTPTEVAWMRWLLPEKAKFTPARRA